MTSPSAGIPASEVPQSTLLGRIAEGDRAALESLYEAFERPVYALIIGIVRDTDEAEDIMQEVFAQVWRKASTYDASLGGAKNWVLRIAHNMAINAMRSKASQSRRQQLPLEAASNTASTDPLLSDALGLSEEIELLNGALARLPAEQQCLITLAFLNGLSHSEIAAHTAIPLGTVKTRIRSGLAQLRLDLRHLAPDHPHTSRQSTRSTSV